MAVTSAFALAAHAVALLAFRGENGATSALIAASASTHPARMRRVLGMLVRAGIVSGREGAGGGYVLARSPDEITLAEVFDEVLVGEPEHGGDGAEVARGGFHEVSGGTSACAHEDKHLWTHRPS